MTKDNKLIDDKVDNKIDDDLIDNLLKGYRKPEDLIGENGLLKQLTKALLERAMAAEMTGHVGYERHDAAGQNSGNSRNGNSAKTLAECGMWNAECGVIETLRESRGS